MLRPLFHLLAASHFWYTSYYDWFYVQIPDKLHPTGHSFGSNNKLRFLTYWDELLQAFLYTICFVNDIIGDNTLKNRSGSFLREFKDALQTCLAFPLAMFVGVTFWGLYLVDRELIFPKIIDPYFPWWLNQCVHTNIMVFITLEMMISHAKYQSRTFGFGVLITFMLTYLVWIHVIYANTGNWVYPVLYVLNLPLRIVFFLVLMALTVVFYIVGEMLNNMLWSEKLKKETKTGGNKKRN